ncbi:MAG TPA: hypothetical protein VK400_19420, partial [Pyrinomonadaceae bacterium]|nr:hypothetical protein [Pyrinomonadaceae bacterium]
MTLEAKSANQQQTSARRQQQQEEPLPKPAEKDEDYYRRQLEAIADNATLAMFIMDERQHC